ncbi:MAG: amidophosphoribosyltransferase [Phycisphaerales bacterium]|nr:amidophosphoribosyltransferase [Phycisphaerales bacterium]
MPQLAETPRDAREKCGVVAVWGEPHPARAVYFGLFALQHRGQESAGIAVTDGVRIERHTGMGLVPQVFDSNTLARLDAAAHAREARHRGRPGGAIGHNRYSTTGASRPENAQPFLASIRGGPLAIAHNGNIVNARELRTSLEDKGHAFYTSSDTEVILHLVASLSRGRQNDPLAEALRMLRGAFSLVFLSHDRVEVARDPWGWRPLSIGITAAGNPVAASETVALDVLGARHLRDVEPGEIVTFRDGPAGGPPLIETRRFADPAPRLAQCVFEHVYFAHPASRIFGQTVQAVREKLGEQLAREAPAAADAVLPMPDSGRSAATGFARASGLPYREGIIPNRYVGRTFIQPSGDERATAARLKLNIVTDLVRGQRIVIVDDSVVRGTTTRGRMEQLRAAGAREIHLRIACPPIRHPCFFGVDFPDSAQLLAHGRDLEQIRQTLKVDSISYLSLDGLLAIAAGAGAAVEEREKFCSACYSGEYRIPIPAQLSKDVLAKC